MSAEQIRNILRMAPDVESELTFRQQADLFEDELLGCDQIPDSYVDLFIEIVSTPEFAVQSGARNFVIRLYPDREKLTPGQLQRILKGFESGYRYYSDERMQLLASDFVARTCKPHESLAILKKMAASAKNQQAKDALRVGLETAMRFVSDDSSEYKIGLDLMDRLS